MTLVEWGAILALAGGAVDLAMKIARVFLDDGCDVVGCPVDVVERLNTKAIPAEDDAMFAARTQATARVRGLARAQIREAFARPIRGPIDLVHREAQGLPPSGVRDLADYMAEIGAEDDTDDGDEPKGAA